MEAFRSFSSRMLLGANDDEDFDHEPEDIERQWAIQRCMELSEYDEQHTIIMWIKKIKQSEHKQHKRLMVITDVRLFTARKGGSKKKPKFEVRREAHILALTSVQEAGLILHIHFRDFEVSFECNDDDLTQKILGQLYSNYTFYNPGFPNDLACKWLDQYKTSQEVDLKKKYPVVGGSLAPWEKPARAFRSWAYFYKEANKDKLSFGLKSILRRPLDDMVVDDERWLHTKSLGCQNSKTVHGAILCVAFTLNILQGVEVSDVRGDAELFFAIQTLLKYNTTLSSLVLDGCATGAEWGGLLVRALAQNPRLALKRFGLKNCKIGDKGVNLWIEGNKKLARHPSCVYLTKANCSNKTMINFIQSLRGSSGGSSGMGGGADGGLEELDISQNSLDSKGTHMLANRLIKDFHNLKMLNLEKCNIDCPRLLTAIEQASKKGSLALEELNLSYNKMTQQDGLILSRILANTGTCAALGLAGCGLAGQTITACLAALLSNEDLQFYSRIDISDNNIGCEAAIMLASIFVFTDRIMSLKLNNCDLTHEGMGYVLMSLLTQPRLKLLEIDFNCKRSQWNSGRWHVNDMLRKLIEKCLNLESLSIKNDPERGYQVDLDHFLHALKTNDSLVCLDISGNSMTSDNLAALKDVVIRNGVLRELHWDENNITSKHILGITHALKQNKALQMVEFPNKDFEKELSREKSSAKKMELQMIKKSFYRAVFENASTQGFQQSTTHYARNAGKRGSILLQRPKNEIYQPQLGGIESGIPQPMRDISDPIMGGGMDALTRPPPRKGKGKGKGNSGNRPPPNPMINNGNGPPPNPMGGMVGGMHMGMGRPPPNPMQGNNRPPPNPMGGMVGGMHMGMGGPPPNPMMQNNGSNKFGNKRDSGKNKKKQAQKKGKWGMFNKKDDKKNKTQKQQNQPPPVPNKAAKKEKKPKKQKKEKKPKKEKNKNKNKGGLPPNQMMGGPPLNPMQNKQKGGLPQNPMMGGPGNGMMGGPPQNPMMGGPGNGPPNGMGGPPQNPMMGPHNGMMGPPNGMGGMPPPNMGPPNGMGGMPPPDMMMMGGMGGMGGMPPWMMQGGNMGMPPPDMMGGMPPNMMMGPPPDMQGGNMGGMPPWMMGGMPPNFGGMGGMPPNMGGMQGGMPPNFGGGGMGGMPPNNMGGMPPNNMGGMPPTNMGGNMRPPGYQ